MDGEEHWHFEKQFKLAFYNSPGHKWQSKRSGLHWIDSELLRDDIAAPLFSIMHNGDCSYVYSSDGGYFCNVLNPDNLRDQLQQRCEEMVRSINKLIPRNPSESADLIAMRRIASDIWDTIDLGCDIEKTRWTIANK